MSLVNVTEDLDGHNKVCGMSGRRQHSFPRRDFVTRALIVREVTDLGLLLNSATVGEAAAVP